MSLAARHLESEGLPTVVLGSARDIVEHCGVPRFAFTDFPLGNPCGRPWDGDMQRAVVASALGLLERASAPRTTEKLPFAWDREDTEEAWKPRYLQVDPARRRELDRLGEQRRASRERARAEGRARSD